jgi:PAS domain S-box-containing protein
VARDPRFVSPLFRRFPHRAGLVLPVREPDRVIGAFYLVWWRTARGFTPAELATLKAIAQQVGLLLRNARLRRESEQRRVAAERAEARYRELVEEVPVGVFRSTPGGEILDVNPALIRLLGFRDREALLAQPVAALYVDPADRERYTAQLAQEGVVREFPVQLRRADGRAVWVQLDTTSVEEDGRTVFCGVIQDITDRQRAEAAERTSQTLRYVASLATAAAHEINNPLAIITARLELLRRRLGDDEDTAAKMDVVLEAGRRISGIIARMGHIERLEMLEGAPREAPMLDLRASAPGDAPPPADR